MKKFYHILLACLVIEGSFRHEVLACKGNDFTNGCECNFIGACSLDGKPLPRLDGLLTKYAPTGVDQFAYKKNRKKALAYLCEGKTVAILYDCNARIPLYAATVMTGNQLQHGYHRPRYHFDVSRNLAEEFQQQNKDYELSNDRNICYEAKSGSKYNVDTQWLDSHPNAKKPWTRKSRCSGRFNLKSPVHKGHLIAASYGRGNYTRIRATFTYTNSVPQFGAFNSGAWCTSEKYLRPWALNNCYGNKTDSKTVRLHIVVGTIPSTLPSLSTRFFGRAGFSDFEGFSNLRDTYGKNTGGRGTTSGPNSYRVNVPRFMWTAACCTYEYEKKSGPKRRKVTGTRSTAFYRDNEPGKEPCETFIPAGSLSQLFSFLKGGIKTIDVFPKGFCNENKYFKKLK